MTDTSRRILFTEIAGWCCLSATMDIDAVEVRGSEYLVDSINPPVIHSLANNWDNIGATVRLYAPTTGVPLGRWVLVAASEGEDIVTYTLRYFDGPTDVPVSGCRIRLEDNYRLCTTIPDWVTGVNARQRWIPVITEFTTSLGQKVNLRGGISSVDGFTINCVYDSNYQIFTSGEGDDQLVFPLIAQFFRREAPIFVDPVGSQGYANLTLEALSQIDPAVNPSFFEDITTFYELVPNLNDRPYLEAFPLFIDGEAIAAVQTQPPPPLGSITSCIRAINGTQNQSHSIQSICYRGLPFVVGSLCRTYVFAQAGLDFTPELKYTGIVEAVNSSDGVADFSLAISSVAYQPRAALTRERGADRVFWKAVVVDTAGAGVTVTDYDVDGIKIQSNIVGETAGGGFEVEELDRNGNNFFPSNIIVQQITASDRYSWIKMSNWITKVRFDKLETPSNKNNSEGVTPVSYWITGIIRFAAGPETDGVFSVFNPRSSVAFIEPANPFFKFEAPGYEDEAPPEWYLLDPIPETDQLTQTDVCLAMWSTPQIGGGEFPEISNEGSIRIAEEIGKILRAANPVLAHLFEPSGGFPGGDYSATARFPNVWKAVHPVDACLQVLCSQTGQGINSAFDTAPSSFGLGIDFDLIDFDTFVEIIRRKPALRLYNAYMLLEGGMDPSKWLEDTILKPFSFALAQDARGRIRLVDLADATVTPGDIQPVTSDLIGGPALGGPPKAILTSDAKDMVDAITLRWKQPWQPTTASPQYQRALTLQGTGANVDTAFGGVTTARTRVFSRVQTSPLNFEVKYASLSGDLDFGAFGGFAAGGSLGETVDVDATTASTHALISSTSQYLRVFRKIISRFIFSAFTADLNQILSVGDRVIIDIPQIPGPNGLLSDRERVGKVINSRIDFEKDLAEYEVLLFDDTAFSRLALWNLAVKVEGITGLTVNTSDNYSQYGAGGVDGLFPHDTSGLEIGTKLRVVDRNFADQSIIVEVTGVTDTSVTLDDVTGINVGDILVPAFRADTVGAIADFLVWFDDSEIPLN